MLKKLLKWLAVFLTAFAAVVAALLFVPKDNGKPYRITITKNQGISSVSRKLAQDGIVYNRYVLVAAAYVMGVHNQLNAGSYRLSSKVSAWDILKRIKKGRLIRSACKFWKARVLPKCAVLSTTLPTLPTTRVVGAMKN